MIDATELREVLTRSITEAMNDMSTSQLLNLMKECLIEIGG